MTPDWSKWQVQPTKDSGYQIPPGFYKKKKSCKNKKK